MDRISTRLVAALLVAAGLVLGTVALVSADDETSDVEIKVQGPITALDCSATPPTITVLGLTIDVSNAAADDNTDGSGTLGDDDGSNDDGGGTVGCTGLTAGQSVSVKLSNDTTFAATELEVQGNDTEVEIKAPIQAVDATAQTIQLLGLTISVNGATVNGSGDDDTEDTPQTVDLSQLIVGQFVEVKLDAAQLPALVATQLDVKNFANQVEVEVDDSDGEEVDDTDNNGNPTDDIDVSVTETVSVQAAAGTRHRTRQVVQFHKAAHGGFTLTGLPTGRAKIVVTRVANGVTKTGRRSVPVRGNVTKSVRVRLRAPKP